MSRPGHLIVVHAPTIPADVMQDISDELSARWTRGDHTPLLAIVVLPRLSLVGATRGGSILQQCPVLHEAPAWSLRAAPAGDRITLIDEVPRRPPQRRPHPALDGALVPVFSTGQEPVSVRFEVRRLREHGGPRVGRPLHQNARSGRLQPFHLPLALTPER